ncbi:MAG: hypothetical protein GEU98_09065 [Pseudonocardiaceae bacterium]|nr:hypothetical protein [Pseudonocardiaceae bacterium]
MTGWLTVGVVAGAVLVMLMVVLVGVLWRYVRRARRPQLYTAVRPGPDQVRWALVKVDPERVADRDERLDTDHDPPGLG